LLGAPVVLPEPGEYVALGAARQAAWAVSGEAAPPTWEVAAGKPESPVMGDDEAARVRELYAAVLAGSRPLLAAGKDWPARR
jgi:xylulokinase